MRTRRLLWAVSLAATLALFISTPRSAFADNVVADDLIAQGDLYVGAPSPMERRFCFPASENSRSKGPSPRISCSKPRIPPTPGKSRRTRATS